MFSSASPRQRGDALGGVVGQPVAGMNLQPQRGGAGRGARSALEFALGLRRVAVGQAFALSAGVQFHHRRADGRRWPRSAGDRAR